MIFTDHGGLCSSQRWLPMPMVSFYSLIDFRTIFWKIYMIFVTNCLQMSWMSQRRLQKKKIHDSGFLLYFQHFTTFLQILLMQILLVTSLLVMSKSYYVQSRFYRDENRKTHIPRIFFCSWRRIWFFNHSVSILEKVANHVVLYNFSYNRHLVMTNISWSQCSTLLVSKSTFES
jgi:hypothetical protein